MFDTEIRGEIKSARVRVTEDGAFVFRTVRMALEREFDGDIAALLGKSAGEALEHLSDGGMSKVVMPMGAVSARGVLSGKTKVALDKITGVKATASVGKAKEDEDAPLKIKVEFEFPFSADAWAMLGAEAGTTIGVTLTRNQLDLPGTGKGQPTAAAAPPADTKANGKKRGTPPKGGGSSFAPPATDLDPQDATTPGEAEEIRAQRLREQRQADEDAWTDGATVS
jgi:hypothetical protein